MCAKIQKNFKNILGIIFLIVSFVLFLFILGFTTGSDVWYDEVFSVSFAQRSFGDIANLTSRDVHPPFYYYYLKLISMPFTAVLGSGSVCFAGKVASAIAWIGLFLISVFYIRKRFSVFTAGFFMLLVTAMPQIATYFVEIRMYALALFLITAHILVAEKIVTDRLYKNIGLWLLFFALGIITAYTQYYACIATVGIYLGTFIGIFIQKNEEGLKERRAGIISLFASAGASIILYLPWLSIVLKQYNNISGSYWMQPLTIRSLAGCVKFVILPVVYAGNLPMISAGLLLIALAVLFVSSFKQNLTLLAVMPILTVVGSGFLLSALGTPIFIYRYLVPVLGGFWLLTAVMADRFIKTEKSIQALSLFVIVPFVFTAVLSFKGFDDEEGKKLYEEPHALEVINSIPTDSVIITNFDHVTAVMGLYRPDCEVYLYNAKIDPLLPDMMENIRDNLSDEGVSYLVKNDCGKKVYFLGSFAAREEIVASFEEMGIDNLLKDSILVERYWINIYELY